MPFHFGNITKLLNLSVIALTLWWRIICCSCRYYSSFLNGFCNAYTTCLVGAWYGFMPFLTCNANVPLNYQMPKENITVCVMQFFCYFWIWYHVHFFPAAKDNNQFPGYFGCQVTDSFLNFCLLGLIFLTLLIYLSSVMVNLHCVGINTKLSQPLTVWHL